MPLLFGDEAHARMSRLDADGIAYTLEVEGVAASLVVLRHTATSITCRADSGSTIIINPANCRFIRIEET